jgi:integrase
MNQPKAAQVASDAFVALADCFLEWVQKNRAADTYEWYRYRLEQFANRCSGLRAADVRPYHVQQWVDSYSHLSQNSRRNLVRSVKRCLTWARQQGYIVENPIRDIEMPGQQSREVCFTVEQFEEMCSFIRDRTFLELCRVTFETGARPQEVLHVEARHFDPEHVRWILPPSESKGKKRPRIVYLTPYAMEVTTRLAARYPEGKLFRNIEDVAWTTDAVNCAFTRLQLRMGKAAMKAKGIELESVLQPELDRADDVPVAKVKDLTAKQRSKIANRAVARFAVKCSLYALRHSWATRALESGVDAITVATLMGHSDTSTLARVYSHVGLNPAHLRQQVERTVKDRSTNPS